MMYLFSKKIFFLLIVDIAVLFSIYLVDFVKNLNLFLKMEIDSSLEVKVDWYSKKYLFNFYSLYCINSLFIQWQSPSLSKLTTY